MTPSLTVSPSTVRPRPRALLLGLLLSAAALGLAGPAQAQHREGERGEFGRAVRVLPPRAQLVPFGGVRYGFHEGRWYAPYRGGFMQVRPPYGVVVTDLPVLATVLTVGAITYWYANDVYYRAAPGGYEVVPPPTATPASSGSGSPSDRLYIYPTQGQTAERQASDEYECHRWAVGQSGFDPTAQATAGGGGAGGGGGASASPDPARRKDYQRAQTACLEGRGYTVR